MDLAHPLRVVTPTVDADVLSVLSLGNSSFTAPGVHRVAGEHSEAGIRKSLKRLTCQGIVLAERAGNAWLYRLNRDHLAAPAIIAIARLRQTLLERIRDEVEQWAESPVYVALFGSAATGVMRLDSDIDLFVVRPDEVEFGDESWDAKVTKLEALVTCWTGNDARVLEYSEAEVKPGLASGTEAVLMDIAAEGIGIYGELEYLRDIVRKAKWQQNDVLRLKELAD